MTREIPLKQWIAEEAARANRSPRWVFQRFSAGLYPNLTIRRVNKRVVFVVLDPIAPSSQTHPMNSQRNDKPVGTGDSQLDQVLNPKGK